MTSAIDLTGIDKPRHELSPSDTALLAFYGIVSKDNPNFAAEFEKALQELEFVPTPSLDLEAVRENLSGIVYTGMELAIATIKDSYEASKGDK